MQHHHEKLFLAGPAGALQALYQPGESAGGTSLPAVVVCHPHPLFGGTMRNKVVYWMARAFEDRGCPVLRFNFRGVEESEGSWGDGHGEAEDVRAAVDWLAARHPGAPLWLAGFSFGGYAGLLEARSDARLERLFAVAPAVNHWSFDFMQGDARPLTIVQGTSDEIVPYDAVATWAATLPQARFYPIEGAGHFFPQHMQAMTEALLADAGLPEPAESL
ncbi:MAG TPA: alpha/beta fold hydrolase [Mariprofundaceae bacterium]|nr:alpha/beta fold hydrolase [Mariprofundaceae bacterium]